MLEKKSDIVRRLVAGGEYKKALKIAKDFRLGIVKADSDAMKLGWECIQRPDFYRQININVDAAKANAIDTVCKLYGRR
jgi:hypothetical protein